MDDDYGAVWRSSATRPSVSACCCSAGGPRSPVFAAVWVHSVVALLVTDSLCPVLLLLVALEAVAELRPLRVSLAALATVLVPTHCWSARPWAASPAGRADGRRSARHVFYTALDVLAWGIGRWVAPPPPQVDRLQERTHPAGGGTTAEAEHAVSAERLRIARELHDIVAHSVTIMVLHAAGAKRVVDTDPARAKRIPRHHRRIRATGHG